jgi:hypothetical protein
MNTAEMKRIVEASPRFKARIVGFFYLVTILTGGIVFFNHGRLGLVVDLITTVCYIAVTVFFYNLSR